MAEDIHHWSECEAIIERLYPELERRLAKVKPDLLIARRSEIKVRRFSANHSGARLAAAE